MKGFAAVTVATIIVCGVHNRWKIPYHLDPYWIFGGSLFDSKGLRECPCRWYTTGRIKGEKYTEEPAELRELGKCKSRKYWATGRVMGLDECELCTLVNAQHFGWIQGWHHPPNVVSKLSYSFWVCKVIHAWLGRITCRQYWQDVFMFRYFAPYDLREYRSNGFTVRWIV